LVLFFEVRKETKWLQNFLNDIYNVDANFRKYNAKESNLNPKIRKTTCIWLVEFSSESSILPPKGT